MLFSNDTPNKVVTFDDRDSSWMIEFIKFKIEQRNSTYKNYHQKILSLDYEILQSEIENVASIYLKESEYYNELLQKLINPRTSSKTYWSILRTFFL